jgi:Reverse transcriptase (RNA-dependent DNA polymerase)
MKEFKEYYSEDQIIKYLCKIRIKYANRRNKKYLLDKLAMPEKIFKQFDSQYDIDILKQLDDLLPKRRLWLKNGQRTYKLVINKQTGKKELKKLDTDTKNQEILYNTIKKYFRSNKPLEFVINLRKFIVEIQTSIDTKTYKISKPDVIPEIKESNRSKKNLQFKNFHALECRPISRFVLRDRIVISLTNKFLTELFDDFFEDSALAFRALKKDAPSPKNHHLAVNKIIAFKNSHIENDVFVAECDLKKFYDTVNHKKCLEAFQMLIEKAKNFYPELDLGMAIYLFQEYLNCYTFKKNVMALNGDKEYWTRQKDSRQKPIVGFYPWVDKEIYQSSYYQSSPDDNIGVPQGGALSGLIANILLDYSDKMLQSIAGLFYVRYCDDMILMHPNESICRQAIETFRKSINEIHLFNHPFKNDFFLVNKNKVNKKSNNERFFETINLKHLSRSFEYSIKSFWASKSKGPYKWGKINIENNCLPWIGFVGYEINYNCEIRIRKRSLNKELEKQKQIVTSIIKRIKKNKRARNNSIYRSAMEKLIGMSVGRIKLYNFSNCENKICWADGFQSLTLNKYSKKQLRILDRNKYKFLNILTHHLGPEQIESKESENDGEILKMKKPFSYYYQAGEKKLKKNEE